MLRYDVISAIYQVDKHAIVYQGSDQIAGQKAYCYSIKGSAGTADMDMVSGYGEQGAPLKMATRSSSFTSEMVATSLGKTVTDEDFKLPGPVTELPKLPGLPPIPSPKPPTGR